MRLIILLLFYLISLWSFSQQVYNDFERNVHIKLFSKSGKFDRSSKNPSVCAVNTSTRCGRYKRSSEEYDNIKFDLNFKISDIKVYTTYANNAPKIKLKIYSTAPPPVNVEFQFIKKSETQTYPVNVYCQFQARTSKQNEWEELVFDFSQIPKGSKVKPEEINQMVLLIAPGTNLRNIFYIDDIKGPIFKSP
jgi:hypothetical protein